METLTVAIMHNKLEEMTSNVNLLTFDIDKSFFFFFSLNFPSISVVILEEFLGKGLEWSEGCFGKIHSAVSGERGSEAEEDKGFQEERSSRWWRGGKCQREAWKKQVWRHYLWLICIANWQRWPKMWVFLLTFDIHKSFFS